jgi:hypothetical protein
MKASLFLLLVFCSVSFRCSDDTPSDGCDSSNPVRHLPWLYVQIEQLKQSSIFEYMWITTAKHNSQTVFILGDCCPFCDSMLIVYNCSGEQIGIVGDSNFGMDLLDNDQLVWKADNSSCVFD